MPMEVGIATKTDVGRKRLPPRQSISGGGAGSDLDRLRRFGRASVMPGLAGVARES